MSSVFLITIPLDLSYDINLLLPSLNRQNGTHEKYPPHTHTNHSNSKIESQTLSDSYKSS